MDPKFHNGDVFVYRGEFEIIIGIITACTLTLNGNINFDFKLIFHQRHSEQPFYDVDFDFGFDGRSKMYCDAVVIPKKDRKLSDTKHLIRLLYGPV